MDFLPLPKLPQQGAVVSSVNPHSREYAVVHLRSTSLRGSFAL